MSVDIRPIKKHIGATVHVGRADLNKPEVVRAVLDALEERGVLVFPRINLTDEEQIAFTDSLGDRVNFRTGTLGVHRSAQAISAQGIYHVTLDPKINQHPEYVFGTFFWHMDGMPVHDIPPPKATLLSARRLSSKGGQTQFASTAAAYEALPGRRRPTSTSCAWCTASTPRCSRRSTPRRSMRSRDSRRSSASVRWSGRRAAGANR